MKSPLLVLLFLMTALQSFAQAIYVLRGVNLTAPQFERIYAANVPLATDGLVAISGHVSQIVSTNLLLVAADGGQMFAVSMESGTDRYVDGHPVNAWFRIVGTYDYIAVNTANRRVHRVVPCIPQRLLSREQFISQVQAGQIDVDLAAYAPKHEPPTARRFGIQPASSERSASAR